MIAARRTARLWLESLEDRTVLDTLRLLNNLGTVEWFSAAAWDANRAPLPGDTVILGDNVNTSVKMELNGVPASDAVTSIVFEKDYAGVLDLRGATLQATSTLTVAGGIIEGGGTLGVDDSGNAASFGWYGGEIRAVNLLVGSAGGQGVAFGWHGGKALNLPSFVLSAATTTTLSTSPNAPPNATVVLEGGSFTNNGTLSQSKSLRVGTGAVALNLTNAGTWEMQAGASIVSNAGGLADTLINTTFTNSGTLQQMTASYPEVFMPFNNGGQVVAGAAEGGLVFKSRGTHDGTFTVHTGATITFEKWNQVVGANGWHDFGNASVITGPGTVTVAKGSQLRAAGGADWAFGTLILDNRLAVAETSTVKLDRIVTVNTFDWKGGLLTGGSRLNVALGGTADLTEDEDRTLDTLTLLIRGTATWTAGQIDMTEQSSLIVESGGTFNAEADSTITSDKPKEDPLAPKIFIRPGGTFQRAPGLNILPTINVPVKNLGGAIKQFGKLALLGGLEQDGGTTEVVSADLTVAGLTVNGGTVAMANTTLAVTEDNLMLTSGTVGMTTTSLQTEQDVVITGGSLDFTDGSLLAAGDVRVEGGSSRLVPNGGSIAGQLLVSGGLLRLAPLSPYAITAGVEVAYGGTLEASGTLNADVLNAGTLRVGKDIAMPLGVADDLTLNGDYTQAATGWLVTLADSVFANRLVVNGLATLDGGYRLEFLEAFEPWPFGHDVLRYAERSGAFAALDLPPLGGGRTWGSGYDLEPYYPDRFLVWVEGSPEA